MKLPRQRLLVAALAAAALLTAPAWASATVTHYTTNFTTLNTSGVTGSANLWFNSNTNMLTVKINASGLEQGTHPEHIHGTFAGGAVTPGSTPSQAILPTVAADDGNTGLPKDGLIETAEGLAAYGPIILPLTINGVAPGNGGIFPTVGANGMLNYSETFYLSNSAIYKTATKIGNTTPYSESDLFPLNFREIVIHGLTVPKTITSVFAGLPGPPVTFNMGQYDPFLPVAAGVIVTAVPEPADLGMMAGGLGLLLGFLWLRRKDVPGREDV